MTFARMQKLNWKRSTEVFDPMLPGGRQWEIDTWLLCMAGEIGEACNVAKKVKRGDFKLDDEVWLPAKSVYRSDPRSQVWDKPEYVRIKVRDWLIAEIADVILYSDLAMSYMGADTGHEVRRKFDEVSEAVRWNGYNDSDVNAGQLVIDPGHVFNLARFDMHNASIFPQYLVFMKRLGDKYPGNYGPACSGTNIQEVCRALISRLKYLDRQIHHWVNGVCIFALRSVINLLEYRAAQRHNRRFRWNWQVEELPFDTTDGHIKY